VRPYLQFARAVIAPLHIARGVQNKVLEAMAMAKPVVATRDATRSLAAKPGEHFWVEKDSARFAEAVKPSPRPLPDEQTRALMELCSRRRQLLEMLTAERRLCGQPDIAPKGVDSQRTSRIKRPAPPPAASTVSIEPPALQPPF